MLNFVYRDQDRVDFYNDENIFIGWLERLRVGRWMQWVYFLEKDCYLSGGCSDEVREMQRKLNASAKSGIKENCEVLKFLNQ